MGYFLEALVAELDPQQVTLIAYANADSEDEQTAKLKGRFSLWRPIQHLSDAAVANLVMGDHIDVLLDLSGHTGGNRLPVFCHRPAPLQVSWLGYFATTGLATMDYCLADPVSVPLGEEDLFGEGLWRLPQSRLCWSPSALTPAVAPAPAAQQRPFTFGCYQALAKINEQVLTLWAQILTATPAARLRVQSFGLDRAQTREDFLRRAQAAGIPAAQLTLHPALVRQDYLRSYAEVDLMLDTFPFPGGTTTVEALWMGVPTLTLTGAGMLRRQGEALLTCVGLSELVCSSKGEYQQQAQRLATVEGQRMLGQSRDRLRQQLQTSALGDAPRFARDFEQALQSMCRSQAQRWPSA